MNAMLDIITPLLIIAVAVPRPLTANWATFSAAGEISVYLGQHVIFNCYGPAGHYVQLKEVGQNSTFEEQMIIGGLPVYVNSLRYEPADCNRASPEGISNCSKLVNMTATDDMNGKAYQCRSYNLKTDTVVFSGEGRVTVRVREPTPTSTSWSTTPSLTVIHVTSSSSAHSNLTPTPIVTATVEVSGAAGTHTLQSQLTLMLLPFLFLFSTLHF